MGKFIGPKAGSRPYRALQRLHELGALNDAAWITHTSFHQSPPVFVRAVVQPLLAWKLIETSGALYRVTSAGLAYLGVLDVAAAPANITPGAYVPPQRPLSAKNRPAPLVVRPGAFDYRDVPSLYAGKHVAFRSSVTVQREDDAA